MIKTLFNRSCANVRWNHKYAYMTPKAYEKTTKPIEHALTIRPDSYKNKAFFDLEKKRIFQSKPIPIGYTNELDDNNIISTNLHDIPIILTKDNTNKISAYYNVCRHRGCKLVQENSSSKVMACPYHKWTYSLSGNLIGTPRYKPDKDVFNKKDYSLFPINIDIVNNIIFAKLDNCMGIDSEKYYGDAFDILNDYPLNKCKIVKTKTYEIDANWKLLIDNFIEYYHLPAVHPGLVTNSGMEEHVCTQGEGKYIGFKTDPLTSSGKAIDVERSVPFAELHEKYRKAAHFQMLYPNMFYFLFPNHMFSVIVTPVSPTKSIEKATLFVNDTSDQAWIDELWGFYDEVNTEDLEICERVQEGLKCDVYNGGRMVPKYESTIHRFHKMVIDDMTLFKHTH